MKNKTVFFFLLFISNFCALKAELIYLSAVRMNDTHEIYGKNIRKDKRVLYGIKYKNVSNAHVEKLGFLYQNKHWALVERNGEEVVKILFEENNGELIEEIIYNEDQLNVFELSINRDNAYEKNISILVNSKGELIFRREKTHVLYTTPYGFVTKTNYDQSPTLYCFYNWKKDTLVYATPEWNQWSNRWQKYKDPRTGLYGIYNENLLPQKCLTPYFLSSELKEPSNNKITLDGKEYDLKDGTFTVKEGQLFYNDVLIRAEGSIITKKNLMYFSKGSFLSDGFESIDLVNSEQNNKLFIVKKEGAFYFYKNDKIISEAYSQIDEYKSLKIEKKSVFRVIKENKSYLLSDNKIISPAVELSAIFFKNSGNVLDYVYTINNKRGIKSMEGREILPPIYDDIIIHELNDNTTAIIVKKDGLFYLSDNENILPTGYQSISKPYQNWDNAKAELHVSYIVKLNDKNGLVDSKGNYDIPNDYTSFELIDENFPFVKIMKGADMFIYNIMTASYLDGKFASWRKDYDCMFLLRSNNTLIGSIEGGYLLTDMNYEPEKYFTDNCAVINYLNRYAFPKYYNERNTCPNGYTFEELLRNQKADDAEKAKDEALQPKKQANFDCATNGINCSACNGTGKTSITFGQRKKTEKVSYGDVQNGKIVRITETTTTATDNVVKFKCSTCGGKGKICR